MTAIRIFISYAHEDETWLQQWLDEKQQKKNRRYFLDFWERSLRAEKEECIFWWDRAEDEGLRGGDRWRSRILEEIARADVAVLLISQDFVISPFIMDEELPQILAQSKHGETEVVPILLSPAQWEKLELHGVFQLTPGKPTPLSRYLDAGEDDWQSARLEVVGALVAAVKRARRKQGAPIPSAEKSPGSPNIAPSGPPAIDAQAAANHSAGRPFWLVAIHKAPSRRRALAAVAVLTILGALVLVMRLASRPTVLPGIPVTTRSWATITTNGAPSARHSASAVWTGDEFIVWDGSPSYVSGASIPSGGRYSPRTNQWRPMSTAGAPSGFDDAPAHWTSSEMLVWTGDGQRTHTPAGAGGRYSPQEDLWRPLSLKGAPSQRSYFNSVWTGKDLFVWGGWDAATDKSVNTGASYDPKTDEWRPIPTEGSPAARNCHAMVWTDKYVVVWGGLASVGDSGLETGGRYDALQERWLPMSTTGAPKARFCSKHAVVWTGKEMLVWDYLGDGRHVGARYDPEKDLWRRMTTVGAPKGYEGGYGLVWTGSRMLLWGGFSGPDVGSPGLASGGLYDPDSDRWEPIMPKGPAPSGRDRFAAVRGDTSIFVWGGADGRNVLNDGVLLGP